MWIFLFLFILCVIGVLIGLHTLVTATTNSQQIIGAFSSLYATICLCAAGIICTINDKK